MNVRRILLYLFSVCLLAGGVAACASSTPAPRQIAAFPQDPGGDWYLPAQPAGGHLVYDGYLALDVTDPETASAEAIRMARELGGYLVNSYASYAGGEAAVTLELRVPPQHFETTLRAFKTLGVLVRETVTGEWPGDRPGWEHFAQITLFLRRQQPSFSPGDLVDWRPAQTLRRALAVSARLLGALADLLIWVVVILGPFALMGWGVSWIARRVRGTQSGSESFQQAPRASEHVNDDLSEGGTSHE